MVDQYSAEDVQNAGRLKQIRMVAKLVNQQNKRALPITAGVAIGIIVVFVLVLLANSSLQAARFDVTLLGAAARLILNAGKSPPGGDWDPVSSLDSK